MKEDQNRPRSRDWHISGWPAILLLPVVFPIGLIAQLFSKPMKRTPAEVAGFLRDFLEDSGGERDWDDFTSVPLADAELEKLRYDAEMIPLPVTDEGRERLKSLLARAEILKTVWIDAGQPK